MYCPCTQPSSFKLLADVFGFMIISTIWLRVAIVDFWIVCVGVRKGVMRHFELFVHIERAGWVTLNRRIKILNCLPNGLQFKVLGGFLWFFSFILFNSIKASWPAFLALILVRYTCWERDLRSRHANLYVVLIKPLSCTTWCVLKHLMKEGHVYLCQVQLFWDVKALTLRNLVYFGCHVYSAVFVKGLIFGALVDI